LTTIRTLKMHPGPRLLGRRLAVPRLVGMGMDMEMRNPTTRAMRRDSQVAWGYLSSPPVESTVAALCAVEAWWQRVTAHMKDDVSESFDTFMLLKQVRLLLCILWKDAIVGKRVEEDVGTFKVA
jgi:hypothetical protein